MRVFIVGIALIVLACGRGPAPTQSFLHPALGEQVNLLTGRNLDLQSGECFTNSIFGLMTVNKTYGTEVAVQNDPGGKAVVLPIMWPIGYTGYRVGSEVAVVDASGHVVGITGQRYILSMGGNIASGDKIEPPVPSNAYLTCGPPAPEPSLPVASG